MFLTLLGPVGQYFLKTEETENRIIKFLCLREKTGKKENMIHLCTDI